MPFDDGLAQLLRDDLAGEAIVEKKMFGGIAFMFRGHMLCGVHKSGAMFRVGKDSPAAALQIPGAREMTFTGRPMRGMIETDSELLADDSRRGILLGLALAFNRTQPPK